MKKNIISLLISLLIISSLYAQKNEYRYPAIRFGIINGFSGQPDMNPHKYLLVPGASDEDIQQMQLQPLSSSMGYTPGFMFSFLYHFDFVGDNAGIFTGLDYNLTGITSKYETVVGSNTLKETHRMHMVGIPLAIKYGAKIWDTQRYVYLGAQFNYIASMNVVQKVNWNLTPSSTKVAGEEYKKTVFSLFFGVNWKVANIQLDFYPSSVFDETYKEPDPLTGEEFLKYDGQVSSFFSIKASLNVPYGWLSENSFWWRRKLRKFPWK